MKFSYSAALSLIPAISAHSWVERAMVIFKGRLVGDPGFPRGFVYRNSTPFPDQMMTYLLPPNSREHNEIYPTDLICKDSQTMNNQTLESPSLIASPLSEILLMYQENGHTTQLNATPGKMSSGTVSIYGTVESHHSDTLTAIHSVWTPEGDGGDGRGRLLARANFDDGECYQVSESPASIHRQKAPQRHHQEFEGNDLWCGIKVKLPVDAKKGSTYALYWVWDWPTKPGPETPNGKVEIYTTCLDVHVI